MTRPLSISCRRFAGCIPTVAITASAIFAITLSALLLARAKDETPAPRTAAHSSSPRAAESRAQEAAPAIRDAAQISEVSHIRAWNVNTYTRIIIQCGDDAQYQTARLSDPDRIYFDIKNASLSRELIRQSIDLPSDGHVKSVRVAQNRSNIVRVVLELSQAKDYSVFQLPNPGRLVVDVYGPNTKTVSAELRDATFAGANTGPANVTRPGAVATSPVNGGPLRSEPSASRAPAVVFGPTKPADVATTATGASSRAATLVRAASHPSTPATTSATATAMPEPMHNGEHSLTRALGLKIGRIVIDAGHGGHDTGTIGPGGLMEKDLCLDLALRVGRIVQGRLPGVEVVFTRDDDTFVSLERRTGIANAAKADLLLSIHANSSADETTSGIETYYLNFNASPGAMEVAARENSLAQSSVHDLQDLVNKIATNEKIEESHDLATDIQSALAKRMQTVRHAVKNRGVRKAPFVVLIGTHMPSVLAEVSFLSNPADEQWLKRADNRERVADGLYQGIESYLQSTNSLETNLGHRAAPLPASVSSGKPARAHRSGTAAAASLDPRALTETSPSHTRLPAATASAANSTAVARSSDAQ